MIAGDVEFGIRIALVLLGALALSFVLIRVTGRDPRRLLTREEWMVAAKVLATAMLLFMLVFRLIYAGLPAGAFIYGRF